MAKRIALERRGSDRELTDEQVIFLLTGVDWFLDRPFGGEKDPDRDAIAAAWRVHGARLTRQHKAEGNLDEPWAEKFLRGAE
jgi:hypothetical protein